VRFWDSSAVVPLVVSQKGSTLADQWFGEDPVIAVWTLTSVEVISALQRLVREQALTEAVAAEAEQRAEELASGSHVVVDVEATKQQARRLLRLHSLRAADALQLGAALLWARGQPSGKTFHTLDDRLGAAAAREGFRVVPSPG
jgi:predicted nucleic acid-binding protein